MSDDDVFSRRWVLTEDELLTMLWSCYCGENPDVVLIHLHASPRRHRRRAPFAGRTPRAVRHTRRRRTDSQISREI